MKSVENRRLERDGYVSYHMRRRIGQRSYIFTLYLSRCDLQKGRSYTAQRILEARRDLRKMIEQERSHGR